MDKVPGIAVKSFILREGKLLLIKRRRNDSHNPGMWEVPGGRLSQGEDPHMGLFRDPREETGLGIEIGNPIRVHHFTREDGQVITMITFLCKHLSGELNLSEEHTEALWMDMEKAKEIIHPSFVKDIEIIEQDM